MMRHSFALARRLNMLCHAALAEAADRFRLQPTEYAVLAGVDDAPGVVQGDLGDRIALDRSSISDVIHRLVERGLIKRAAMPGNRRCNVLHITKAGRALRAAALPVVEEAARRVMAPLTDHEFTSLTELLTRISGARELLTCSGQEVLKSKKILGDSISRT